MPKIDDPCDDADDGDDDKEDVIVLNEVAPMTARSDPAHTRSRVQGMVPIIVKIVNFQKG